MHFDILKDSSRRLNFQAKVRKNAVRFIPVAAKIFLFKSALLFAGKFFK